MQDLQEFLVNDHIGDLRREVTRFERSVGHGTGSATATAVPPRMPTAGRSASASGTG